MLITIFYVGSQDRVNSVGKTLAQVENTFESETIFTFHTATRDNLFSQLEDVNHRHTQLQSQLKDAEADREWAKALEQELEAAKKERQQAIDERDKALASSVVASNDRERQILRLFKHVAEETLGADPKHPRETKNWFHLDGQKVVPAKYEQMNLDNLLNIALVEPKCREMIAQNTFFELKALQKGSDIEMVQHCIQTQDDDREGSSFYIVGSVPCSQDLKTQPQLFYALYSWRQFYLQCFPKKTAAFLEYLAFMTKYGIIYPVPTLVKFDNKIRQFYVQHPHLNWDMTGPQVQRFLLDANIDLQQANSQFTSFNMPQKQKSCSRHHGGSGGHWQQAWNQGQQYQHH